MKNKMEDIFCTKLDNTTQTMLECCCNYAPEKQEQLVRALSNLDFDTAELEVLGLLPILYHLYGSAGMPPNILRRVRKIHKYFLLQNVSLLSGMKPIIHWCNEQDIPVMLCKGSAYRFGYRTDVPRQMHDLDIVVHDKDFTRVVEVAKKFGYDGITQPHSIDLKKESAPDIQLDIHHQLYKEAIGQTKEERIWKRCNIVEISGDHYYLPGEEDWFVHTLLNELWNIISNDRNVHLKWIVDTHWLLTQKKDFDWRKTLEIAKELGLHAKFNLALKVYSKFLSGIDFPIEIQQFLENCYHTQNRTCLKLYRYYRTENIEDMEYFWHFYCYFAKDSILWHNIVGFFKYFLNICQIDSFSQLVKKFVKKPLHTCKKITKIAVSWFRL